MISELINKFNKVLVAELGSEYEVGMRFSNDFVLTHPRAAILINLDNVYCSNRTILVLKC